jgi:hypothetical protein
MQQEVFSKHVPGRKKTEYFLMHGADDVLEVEFGRFADVRPEITAAYESGTVIEVVVITKKEAQDIAVKYALLPLLVER